MGGLTPSGMKDNFVLSLAVAARDAAIFGHASSYMDLTGMKSHEFHERYNKRLPFMPVSQESMKGLWRNGVIL